MQGGKREKPYQAARREVQELMEIVRQDSREHGHPGQDDAPPPAPGSWPIWRLQRLLNLAADTERIYAYSWLLQIWLGRHGVIVPSGIFSKNIWGPGPGRQQSAAKLKLGKLAAELQMKLILGDTSGLSDAEFDELRFKALTAKPSYRATEIAVKLRRRLRGKGKEAARKYVVEAMSTYKSMQVLDYLGGSDLTFWADISMIMEGKPPSD